MCSGLLASQVTLALSGISSVGCIAHAAAGVAVVRLAKNESTVSHVYVPKMVSAEGGKCPSIHAEHLGRFSAQVECVDYTTFSDTQSERTCVLKILS